MKTAVYLPSPKGKNIQKEFSLEVNVKKNLSQFFYLSKTFQFKSTLNIGLALMKDDNFFEKHNAAISDLSLFTERSKETTIKITTKIADYL